MQLAAATILCSIPTGRRQTSPPCPHVPTEAKLPLVSLNFLCKTHAILLSQTTAQPPAPQPFTRSALPSFKTQLQGALISEKDLTPELDEGPRDRR